MTPGGMINNVSEYKLVKGANIDSSHPHGDLDRIIINGGIMPLRDKNLKPSNPTNWKKCLRGEDIAFLMEGLNERMSLARTTDGYDWMTFSSKLDYQDINLIISMMKYLYGYYHDNPNYKTYWFLKPDVDLSSLTPTVLDSDDDFYDIYPGTYYNLSDCGSRNTILSKGSVLQQSVISTLFDDMNRLQRELYRVSYPTIIDPPTQNAIFYNNEDGGRYCSGIDFTPSSPGTRGSVENYVVGSFTVLTLDPFYTNSMLIPVDRTNTVTDIVQRVMPLLGLPDYTSNDKIVYLFCSEVYVSLVAGNRTRWT